jgi:hypothetical protein
VVGVAMIGNWHASDRNTCCRIGTHTEEEWTIYGLSSVRAHASAHIAVAAEQTALNSAPNGSGFLGMKERFGKSHSYMCVVKTLTSARQALFHTKTLPCDACSR